MQFLVDSLDVDLQADELYNDFSKSSDKLDDSIKNCQLVDFRIYRVSLRHI